MVIDFFLAEAQNGGLNGTSINCRYDSSLGNCKAQSRLVLFTFYKGSCLYGDNSCNCIVVSFVSQGC